MSATCHPIRFVIETKPDCKLIFTVRLSLCLYVIPFSGDHARTESAIRIASCILAALFSSISYS